MEGPYVEANGDYSDCSDADEDLDKIQQEFLALALCRPPETDYRNEVQDLILTAKKTHSSDPNKCEKLIREMESKLNCLDSSLQNP
jgi:hypothetical protein